jgi:hypothetical protein
MPRLRRTLMTPLVVALVLVGCTGAPGTSVASLAPTASPAPTPSASVEPTSSPTPTPTQSPTPTPKPTPIGACDTNNLAARITMWEGAAGSRIGHVELTNTGTGACTIRTLERPQLVDGHGSVLINGTDPTSTKTIAVGPGDVLKTLVDDANYCGPDPAPPVSIAFVFASGSRIVASPLSPSDDTVPPCNGNPGSAGEITMHAWAS